MFYCHTKSTTKCGVAAISAWRAIQLLYKTKIKPNCVQIPFDCLQDVDWRGWNNVQTFVSKHLKNKSVIERPAWDVCVWEYKRAGLSFWLCLFTATNNDWTSVTQFRVERPSEFIHFCVFVCLFWVLLACTMSLRAAVGIGDMWGWKCSSRCCCCFGGQRDPYNAACACKGDQAQPTSFCALLMTLWGAVVS